MNPTLGALLAVSFLVAIVAVFGLVWAIWKKQFSAPKAGALTVYIDPESPRPEDPTTTRVDGLRPGDAAVALLRKLDASTSKAVLGFAISAVFWLVMGSVAGLVASLKLHMPDLLVEDAALTFGRLRSLHLNWVAYGWLSMAGVAVALWMLPRLLKTELRGGYWAFSGMVLWNIGLTAGSVAIACGWTDGAEWMEVPWQFDGFFVVAGGLVAVPLLLTLPRRKVDHLYVSVWYIVAALLWFPILFVVANFPGVHFGVEHALVNWWFAHNALGLWFTPMALAAAYYLIPKIIGRPIYSYQLSLLGFWSLALFYSQVGVHHLIGGPVPLWVVTLSIVTSVAMVIPVIAVAVNHHMTIWKHRGALKHSPVLRFVVLGAIMYTVASLQGSLHSIRYFNNVTHFTHFTVAHAHLGAYGFASFIFFGAIYFMLPRVTGKAWPKPAWITLHMRLVVVGFVIYVVFLSIGGILQGIAMLDEARPFADSVTLTMPYLLARSIGGTLMLLGHFVFAGHVLKLLASPVDQAMAPTGVEA
jgi:cytochrome c oxidase cbb3-type subunit 1